MNAEDNSSDNRAIDKDANAGKSNTKPNTSIGLKNRIDALEQAIEEAGKTSELRKDVQKYVKYLEADLKDIMWFRRLITAIAVGFSLFLFFLFCFLIIFPPCWFSIIDDKIKIPFLATLSIMSVLLMSLCLRGVYQTHKDRNYGDFVPESLKIMLKGSGADT